MKRTLFHTCHVVYEDVGFVRVSSTPGMTQYILLQAHFSCVESLKLYPIINTKPGIRWLTAPCNLAAFIIQNKLTVTMRLSKALTVVAGSNIKAVQRLQSLDGLDIRGRATVYGLKLCYNQLCSFVGEVSRQQFSSMCAAA